MRRKLSGLLLAACASAGCLTASSDLFADESIRAIPAFVERHWQRPLAPQGDPPAGFSPLEASLDPHACGSCHPQQLQDWQGSLHAHAMGPGLLGQLLAMDPADRAGHQSCLRCHAPLAEQADEVATLLSGGTDSGQTATRGVIPDALLYTQGLVCAACHVRARRIFGPPRRAADNPAEILPHGGFETTKAFEDSLFCAACHQFDADGYVLNGKLLENTYEEWRQSPQAAAGESCQSCHMPDRRHLWRGIHDRQTVKNGVSMTLDTVQMTSDHLTGRLTLTNSGTAHRLPTYVTPRLVLEGVQLDAFDEPIAETRQEWIVARQVSLDLSEELFDTRLAPGESATLAYRQNRHAQAVSLRFRIQVEPDRFYRDFYRSMLDSDSNKQTGEQIRQALHAAESSVYTLFLQQIPLRLNGL